MSKQIHKAYKVEIRPTPDQIQLFWKAFGTRRFVYNHMLDTRIKYYEEHKKSYPKNELKRYLTVVKQEHKEWMYDVPKSVHQNAFADLDDAFSRFFESRKKDKSVGYPKFKSKNKSSNSFTMDNDRFKITPHGIQFQVIGLIKFKENNYIPRKKNDKYSYATVSYHGGKYFVSVSMSREIEDVTLTDEVIGVDVGVHVLSAFSNGMVFENPKAYKKNLRKLKRLNRSMSRKQKTKDDDGHTKWSKNRQKAKAKLAKHHYHVAEIRRDTIHKMTSALVKTKPSVIVIEDLKVKNMLKNRKLSQALSDSSFGEIKRQIAYKSEWAGILVIYASQWFPSSKLCNSCGVIKEELTLNDRTYKCECGYVEDRDINAAYNLRDYYLKGLAS